MPGMILLEPGNRILEECLRSQICATEKRIPMDVRLCDFDDVSYRILVDKSNLDVVKLSVNIPPFQRFKDKGGQAAVDKYYGEFKSSAETGFDVTLSINCPSVKDPEAAIKKFVIGEIENHGRSFRQPFFGVDGRQESGEVQVRLATRHDHFPVPTC